MSQCCSSGGLVCSIYHISLATICNTFLAIDLTLLHIMRIICCRNFTNQSQFRPNPVLLILGSPPWEKVSNLEIDNYFRQFLTEIVSFWQKPIRMSCVGNWGYDYFLQIPTTGLGWIFALKLVLSWEIIIKIQFPSITWFPDKFLCWLWNSCFVLDTTVFCMRARTKHSGTSNIEMKSDSFC